MRFVVAITIAAATLTVTPLVPYAGERPSERNIEKPTEIIGDASITARIKADLARDKTVSAANINVDTKNQAVTLSGNARSKEEADKAAAIAKAAPGVTSVKNDIRVGSR
jgi:osmotically-inducible protein OsmY